MSWVIVELLPGIGDVVRVIGSFETELSARKYARERNLNFVVREMQEP